MVRGNVNVKSKTPKRVQWTKPTWCVFKNSADIETVDIERDQISNSDRIISTTGRLMIKNKTVTRLEVSKTAFSLFLSFLV